MLLQHSCTYLSSNHPTRLKHSSLLRGHDRRRRRFCLCRLLIDPLGSITGRVGEGAQTTLYHEEALNRDEALNVCLVLPLLWWWWCACMCVDLGEGRWCTALRLL